jgi:geranylgeranyl diphosphate synthase, type I
MRTISIDSARPHGERTEAAPRWLAATAALVEPALREAISSMHPDMAQMALYHKGWVDAGGRPIAGQTHGKGVRPALALWSARAAGADAMAGLAAAVAVELVHDFSLLHDDIIDDDHIRRGRPAAWRVYGTGPVVLLGDTLHAVAMHVVTEASPNDARAATRLARTILELCRGQAEDLEFEHRDQVSVPEYLAMVEHKTGALMRCATTLGAILAGADDSMVAELARLGGHLGVLFQIVDDLLGVFGDPAITGKPVGSDLARHKKTLPILAALTSTSSAGQELSNMLRRPELSEQELSHAAVLVERAGGRARAELECAKQYRQARHALVRLGLPDDTSGMLQELLTFLINRTA